jgi:hypothetical protein
VQQQKGVLSLGGSREVPIHSRLPSASAASETRAAAKTTPTAPFGDGFEEPQPSRSQTKNWLLSMEYG